ncbi:MAG: phytanoyl-CoA dioxygenase family protein [Alphaproteobacteria bacterium]|nr:phytanoyl-CoA dioxygenase family protein [Alphaproteobacteria bacterium]
MNAPLITRPSFRPEELPVPTRDLARACADYDEFGYCLIADALSPGTIAEARARLVAQADAERAKGLADLDSNGRRQRVWFLPNKGRVFRDILRQKDVNGVLAHSFGHSHYILGSFTAYIVARGVPPQSIHQDQGWFGQHTERPIVANVVWAIDDLSAENGGTVLYPRSHRVPRAMYHNDPNPDGDFINATCPKGTAIVFDGRLWHGTGENHTDAPRHALFSYFMQPYMRAQENYALGIRPEVYENLDDELRERLGFRVWLAYGRAGVPNTKHLDFVGPNPAPIGELAPDGTPRELGR